MSRPPRTRPVRFGSAPTPRPRHSMSCCKAHELDNLYVVDGSFMPSIGAVNPTLTIIANAIRVSEHIASRLSSTRSARAPSFTRRGRAGNRARHLSCSQWDPQREERLRAESDPVRADVSSTGRRPQSSLPCWSVGSAAGSGQARLPGRARRGLSRDGAAGLSQFVANTRCRSPTRCCSSRRPSRARIRSHGPTLNSFDGRVPPEGRGPRGARAERAAWRRHRACAGVRRDLRRAGILVGASAARPSVVLVVLLVGSLGLPLKVDAPPTAAKATAIPPASGCTPGSRSCMG